jgi:type II secretory pathway pseudopilin PulG
MAASASLSSSVLSVSPGDETVCSVVVANSGQVVEEFVIDVVGDAAAWAVAQPSSVSLMPGESATVNVLFRPPRSAQVAAQSVPFGIRVSSRDDPYGSVVEEGVVEVAAFTALDAELVPAKAEGSRKANYEVAVDNTGNHPVNVELRALDSEGDLDFRFERNRFALDAGTAAFVRLQARPRRRFLRGQPQRHRFQVFVYSGQGEPVVVDGTMVQRQLLPKWLLPVLIGLLLAIALLAALWFAVLRPAVKSVAREAAAQESNEVMNAAQQAQVEAEQAKQEAEQAKQNSDQAMVAAGLDPNNPSAPSTKANGAAPPPSAPTDFRLAADSPFPITANTSSFNRVPYTLPDDSKTLVITDLVLQNPRGDAGTLRILRILRDSGDTETVLLESGLNNFRDLDQHWLQPWVFRPGEQVVLAVSCQNPPEKGGCTPSVSFSGRVEG